MMASVSSSLVYSLGMGKKRRKYAPLDDVIEALCEFYGDVDGYQHLYLVAHELSRAAEVLREKAGIIEDSTSAVSDLFNLTDDREY